MDAKTYGCEGCGETVPTDTYFCRFGETESDGGPWEKVHYCSMCAGCAAVNENGETLAIVPAPERIATLSETSGMLRRVASAMVAEHGAYFVTVEGVRVMVVADPASGEG